MRSARAGTPDRATTAVAALLLLVVVVVTTAAAAAPVEPEPLRFEVTYDASVTDSYTGRVYVMLGTGRRPPRRGPSWFGRDPFFAVDVTDWRPDTPLVVGADALAWPAPIAELEAGRYRVQAVMRLNPDSPHLGAPGNAHSANTPFDLDAAASGAVALRIDRVPPPRDFRGSGRVRIVEHRSALLSDFHGRDMMLRAAVIVPEGYDDAEVRYPAFYWIGGFGMDHTSAAWLQGMWEGGRADRIVRVVLDPLCFGGHHVFTDSANNGPCGRALVLELIPHLEATFRLVPAPTARFVSGVSSGGWSSLWLQVTWPDVFGGVWALAPDPVDFRDFQQIDLYAPGANVYVDAAGARRPIARRGDDVMLWFPDFAAMEVVMGEGGQLRSFEWVFSPRGDDGLPRPLYDRATGAVDPAVAEAWRAYDIREVIERSWETLAPKLAGKIHVVTGELDTFYLDGATRLLKSSLAELGSDADVRLLPGVDHGGVMMDRDIRREIDDWVVTTFEASHPDEAPQGLSPQGTVP